MDLTPKQQASEAIRQAESILIVTGQRPNIDQIASVVALTHALRKLGKKVSPLVTDRVPHGAQFIAKSVVQTSLAGARDFIMQLDLSKGEVDKVKYTVEDNKLNVHVTPFSGEFKPADVAFDLGDYHFDLIIALGVPRRVNLDKVFEQNPRLLENTPLLNLDYHRINEQYGAVNLLETNSSTLSEMVLAQIESVQGGLLDQPIATALLAGIMASTDRFTAPHTSAKSLTVAAQMMAMGGDQPRVIKEVFGERERPRREERPSQVKPRTEPPKPEPQVMTQDKPVEVDQVPAPDQEVELEQNVEEELDAFIGGEVDSQPLQWEKPENQQTTSLEDGVINYRP